jgi:hypothetical protein
MVVMGIAARLILLASILCLGATQLPGQQQESGALSATAVPPESWEGVAMRLAVSLVDPAAGAQEEPLFLPKATARRFGRSEPRPPSTLRDQFNGMTILTVETFEYPGGQVVAGTAAALARQRLEKSIPDGLLRAMTPTPAEAAAAEQTAIRWVTAALSPQKGDRLAILLLWDVSSSNRPAFERLSFVMFKAGRLPDGRYRVQALAYGTAQEAVLEGM